MASNKIKILEGALAGAVLGVVAGLMLAPESGKELRRDLKKKSAEFYHYLGAQLKKLKKVSEKDYKILVRKAMETYSKTKKLSKDDVKKIVSGAESYWKHLKKHA